MAPENLPFDGVSTLSVFSFSFGILSVQDFSEVSDFLQSLFLLLLAFVQLRAQNSILLFDVLKLKHDVLLITVDCTLPGKAKGVTGRRQSIEKVCRRTKIHQ